MNIFVFIYFVISVVLIVFAKATVQDGAVERPATFGEHVVLGIFWPLVLWRIIKSILDGTVKFTRDKK